MAYQMATTAVTLNDLDGRSDSSSALAELLVCVNVVPLWSVCAPNLKFASSTVRRM